MGKVDKWCLTAFKFESEVWRARTSNEMIVLGKLDNPDYFSLFRFNTDGGYLIHISKEEALWITMAYAPEKLDMI